VLKLVGNEAYVQAVRILPHIPEPDIIFGNIGGIPVRWVSQPLLFKGKRRERTQYTRFAIRYHIALQRLINPSLRKTVSNARRHSVPAIVEVD
jgi:hypothetical protein